MKTESKNATAMFAAFQKTCQLDCQFSLQVPEIITRIPQDWGDMGMGRQYYQ